MINPGIRLTATGLTETLQRVDALQALYIARVSASLQAWAEATVAKIIEGHPPGGPHPSPGEMPVYGQHAYIDRTGRLTRSVGFTIERGHGRGLTLTVFALMPYAELVEFGQPPHARPYPFFWPVIWERFPLLGPMIAADMNALFEEYSEYGRS